MSVEPSSAPRGQRALTLLLLAMVFGTANVDLSFSTLSSQALL